MAITILLSIQKYYFNTGIMSTRKENIISYFKILAGLMLVFPLVHVYWALDFGLLVGGIIAAVEHLVLWFLGIMMFNYLEYGRFSLYAKYDEKDDYYVNRELINPTNDNSRCYHPVSDRVITHRGRHCGNCGKRF